ncbi:MAG TPA: hypothetical protein VM534_06955 [Thermoanaerobaculia bacterium]|nr:hypothetical protein [Thermoanaerobaculia bacterium]
MPDPIHPIQVNFTLNQGVASFSFNPDHLQVNEATSTVQWTLVATDGSGTPLSGADMTNVWFKEDNWPGTTPAKQPDGTWTCTDLDDADGVYHYGVTVHYNGQDYNGDPEVDNQRPGG